MTKIMLVEDDKSLREIYSVRLQAENYEIVSAGDGEEALALAIKERPDLIVSDVMMPKISGFDMLDILRSTTETRDIKVIMMTALSSEEQRLRGEALGADKYLVKSQVGIEDVVRVVHEMLGDTPEAPAPTPPAAAEMPQPVSRPVPQMQRSVPERPQQAVPTAPQPIAPPAAAPVEPVQSTEPSNPTPTPAPTPVAQSVPVPAPQPPSQPANSVPVTAVPTETQPSHEQPLAPRPQTQTPKPPSVKNRVIQPLNDPSSQPIDIQQLLDKELAKEAGLDDLERPVVQTAAQEREALEQELANFEAGKPAQDDLDADESLPPPPPTPPAAPGV